MPLETYGKFQVFFLNEMGVPLVHLLDNMFVRDLECIRVSVCVCVPEPAYGCNLSS